MNTEFLRELRLEPDRISRDLEVSEGLARTHRVRAEGRQEGESLSLSVAATFFRRAAANALLLGSYASAKRLFLEASFAFQELDLPYSVVLSALSSEGPRITERLTYRWLNVFAEHEVVDGVAPQLAYVVLAQSSLGELRQIPVDRLARIRGILDPYRTRQLGVLGVSVGALLDLSDSLVPEIGQRRIDLDEALAPFLGTYNSAIRQAIQHHYHWERLALPFHPADPDTFGILALTNSAVQIRRNVVLQQIIEQAAIARESKYLMTTMLEGMTGNLRDTNLHI